MKSHYYTQVEGLWLGPDGLGFLGYSGTGAGKNNPEHQYVPNFGPLPVGQYTIGELQDPVGSIYGPGWMRLTPAADTVMKGRGGFLVHWDTKGSDGIGPLPDGASHGCICPYDGTNIARIFARQSRMLWVCRNQVDMITRMILNGDTK